MWSASPAICCAAAHLSSVLGGMCMAPLRVASFIPKPDMWGYKTSAYLSSVLGGMYVKPSAPPVRGMMLSFSAWPAKPGSSAATAAEGEEDKDLKSGTCAQLRQLPSCDACPARRYMRHPRLHSCGAWLQSGSTTRTMQCSQPAATQENKKVAHLWPPGRAPPRAAPPRSFPRPAGLGSTKRKG